MNIGPLFYRRRRVRPRLVRNTGPMISIRNCPHPRGGWEVQRTFPVGGMYGLGRAKTQVWRYKIEANAFKRFNDLRERWPSSPFTVCGFRSEPDPVAPRLNVIPIRPMLVPVQRSQP